MTPVKQSVAFLLENKTPVSFFFFFLLENKIPGPWFLFFFLFFENKIPVFFFFRSPVSFVFVCLFVFLHSSCSKSHPRYTRSLALGGSVRPPGARRRPTSGRLWSRAGAGEAPGGLRPAHAAPALPGPAGGQGPGESCVFFLFCSSSSSSCYCFV